MSLAISSDLLLPPSSLVLLALLALLVPRWGRRLAVLMLSALLALSMPSVSALLLASLDPGAVAASGQPAAIIVLGGDVERTTDPAQPDIGALSLERVRAGAALHRRTGLPLLVTGGLVGDTEVAIGALMARSMTEDFQVPVRWTEAASRDTWENARLSAPMLQAAGIGHVYVVTHAWHMRRSLLAFRQAGLDPTPAPVRQDPVPQWGWSGFLPRASAWQRSYYALHEWVGLLYYQVRR